MTTAVIFDKSIAKSRNRKRFKLFDAKYYRQCERLDLGMRHKNRWQSDELHTAVRSLQSVAELFGGKGYSVVEVDDETNFEFPLKLAGLADIVSSSRFMLHLEPDWNGEGANPISRDTYLRTLEFLKTNMAWATTEDGRQFPLPRIMPGVNGNVDLVWKSNDTIIIIRFKEDEYNTADFFGDDLSGNRFKTTLDIEPKNLTFQNFLRRLF